MDVTTDQNAFLTWLAANGPGIFVIVVVLGTLVFLAVVAKKLWPGVRNSVLIVDALLQLPEFIETTKTHQAATEAHFASSDTSLQIIKHEVLPNNGNSLRDEVNRQGITQKSSQGIVRGLGRRVKAIEASLEMTQQPEAVQRARERAKATRTS